MEDEICLVCGQDEYECFCTLCRGCKSPDDIEDNDLCAKCNEEQQEYIETVRTRN